MAGSLFNKVLEQLRRWSEPRLRTDVELVDQLVAKRDESAFAELMARHGPMVWKLCLRSLGNSNDAEDAFQAVFFLLFRKANTIRKADAVASWLFGVANRVTKRAQARRAKMPPRSVPGDVAAAPEQESSEPQPFVLEEVDRLPTKYRDAVVLCYLEGRTSTDAAIELGCAPATIRSRLASARTMLERRLVRRGVALSALAAPWSAQLASAQPSVALLNSTRHVVHLVLEGKSAALSGEMLSLTRGVVPSLMSRPWKAALLCLAIGAIAMAGWGVSHWQPKETEATKPGDRKADADPLLLANNFGLHTFLNEAKEDRQKALFDIVNDTRKATQAKFTRDYYQGLAEALTPAQMNRVDAAVHQRLLESHDAAAWLKPLLALTDRQVEAINAVENSYRDKIRTEAEPIHARMRRSQESMQAAVSRLLDDKQREVLRQNFPRASIATLCWTRALDVQIGLSADQIGRIEELRRESLVESEEGWRDIEARRRGLATRRGVEIANILTEDQRKMLAGLTISAIHGDEVLYVQGIRELVHDILKDDDAARKRCDLLYEQLGARSKQEQQRAVLAGFQNLLSEDEFNRLRQACWQDLGLASKPVHDALGLDSEQVKKIHDLREEFGKAQEQADQRRQALEEENRYQAAGDRKPMEKQLQEDRERLGDKHEEITRKMFDVLSPTQKEAWRRLAGRPFQRVLLTSQSFVPQD